MVIKKPRTMQLPDPAKVDQFRRCPDLGPGLLFFSGGSALKKTSAELIKYTHNSIHIITVFDSGGSSAILREAFKMPAVGDVRNRLLTIADRSLHGYPEILRLFSHRFPEDGNNGDLLSEIDNMIQGKHELIRSIPDPMRKIIRHQFYQFKNHMPKDFNFRGASLGNLLLTSGYLDNNRNFDSIIYIFSRLVQARGIVRPIVNKDLYLIAELEDGSVVRGQHMLTGKKACPISSKVKNIYLSETCKKPRPADICISEEMQRLINEAEIICYPMGSFYSSIIANLLPKGVGKAVSKNSCPKIYIPNTDCSDPETFGMNLMEQIEKLVFYLQKDAPEKISVYDVLNYVIIDEKNACYPGKPDQDLLKNMGIEIINMPLVSSGSFPYIDPKLLVPLILSLPYYQH